MILFNWLLNIPFSLKLFGVGVSVKNKRFYHQNLTEMQPRSRIEQAEGISQATLDKILNVCSLALSSNTPVSRQNTNSASTSVDVPKIRRSASTGRLPNNLSFEGDGLSLENTVKRRFEIAPRDGRGDGS